VQNQKELSQEFMPSAVDAGRPPIIPTPNDPPWNTPVAVGTWIASVLAILVLPTLVLLPYLLSQNIQVAGNPDLVGFLQTDPMAVLLQVLAVIPAHILTLLLAWLVVTRGRQFSFRQTLGWSSAGTRWWHYALILGGFFLVAAVTSYFFPEQENDLIRILRSSRAAAVAVAVMATFTAPVVEEVIYRGVLYSAFQRTFGVVAAVVLVTLLFSVVHVPQYYPSGSTIFLLTLLSLILTLIRVKTGSLLPCIILHTIFNAFQSMILLAEPYFPTVEAPVKEVSAMVHLIF
jgi:uncharacterized protein